MQGLHTLNLRILACLIGFAPGLLLANEICVDREAFALDGWQHEDVQKAMDRYLRDKRMRVHWQQEPVPPNAVGRDYYEWLWLDDFGAKMKAELTARYCGGVAE